MTKPNTPPELKIANQEPAAPTHAAIPISTFNAILGVLQKRPFEEVAELMGQLQSARAVTLGPE